MHSYATGDRVFRTYFINSRGDEQMGNTWNYLDITALGRQEEWEESPEGYPQTPPYEWWNWHDEYGNDEASARVLEQVRRGRAAGRSGRRHHVIAHVTSELIEELNRTWGERGTNNAGPSEKGNKDDGARYQRKVSKHYD